MLSEGPDGDFHPDEASEAGGRGFYLTRPSHGPSWPRAGRAGLRARQRAPRPSSARVGYTVRRGVSRLWPPPGCLGPGHVPGPVSACPVDPQGQVGGESPSSRTAALPSL